MVCDIVTRTKEKKGERVMTTVVGGIAVLDRMAKESLTEKVTFE